MIGLSAPAANAIVEPTNYQTDSLAELQTLPESLSDQEMEELLDSLSDAQDGPVTFEIDADPDLTQEAPDKNISSKATSATCTLDTGLIWPRASGSIYPHGTIGGKPTIRCGAPTARLAMSTNLYQKTFLGWTKVAGQFNSQNSNSSSLTQKHVEYIRNAAQPYSHFQMIVMGEVTYYGHAPIPGGSKRETTGGGLPCS